MRTSSCQSLPFPPAINPPPLLEAPWYNPNLEFSTTVTVEPFGRSFEVKAYQAEHKPMIPPPMMAVWIGRLWFDPSSGLVGWTACWFIAKQVAWWCHWSVFDSILQKREIAVRTTQMTTKAKLLTAIRWGFTAATTQKSLDIQTAGKGLVVDALLFRGCFKVWGKSRDEGRKRRLLLLISAADFSGALAFNFNYVCLFLPITFQGNSTGDL